MNEIFDKLILRVFFTVCICLILLIYRYAHVILYPSTKRQILKRFTPSKNSPDTIHFFSRLIGISIVFSEFYFYVSKGIVFASAYFFIQSFLIICLYLGSLYILESIVLYNFDYDDEISKRQNYSYAMISFAHAIGSALITKTILQVSQQSIIMLFFLWLFSIVLIGFATKTYPLLSRFAFNRLVVQKNISVALSYTGFILGWSLIISSSLNNPLNDIKWFGIQVLLKILLSLIIFPIFRKGIMVIFNIQDDYDVNVQESKNNVQETGYGIYEGVLFFTSAFLTTVITGQIHFGTFYPVY